MAVNIAEAKELKRLARKAGIKVPELQVPARIVKISREEKRVIEEYLAIHGTVVIAKSSLNGARKRRGRIYTVERYMALKNHSAAAQRQRYVNGGKPEGS